MQNIQTIKNGKYQEINNLYLSEISGGNGPTLVAGACLIGMAAAGPIGCAGTSLFAWGYYNGYEGAKRGK
ncbi:bacteriocin [Streptococcus hongkongensis]|nr:hypothetical protein NC01_02360 [Streptococcus uberis]